MTKIIRLRHAMAKIDDALPSIQQRENVPSAEMVDLLLDIRNDLDAYDLVTLPSVDIEDLGAPPS